MVGFLKSIELFFILRLFIFIFFGFSNASNTFHTLDSMTFFAMFTGLFTAMNRLNYKGTL